MLTFRTVTNISSFFKMCFTDLASEASINLSYKFTRKKSCHKCIRNKNVLLLKVLKFNNCFIRCKAWVSVYLQQIFFFFLHESNLYFCTTNSLSKRACCKFKVLLLYTYFFTYILYIWVSTSHFKYCLFFFTVKQ